MKKHWQLIVGVVLLLAGVSGLFDPVYGIGGEMMFDTIIKILLGIFFMLGYQRVFHLVGGLFSKKETPESSAEEAEKEEEEEEEDDEEDASGYQIDSNILKEIRSSLSSEQLEDIEDELSNGSDLGWLIGRIVDKNFLDRPDLANKLADSLLNDFDQLQFSEAVDLLQNIGGDDRFDGLQTKARKSVDSLSPDTVEELNQVAELLWSEKFNDQEAARAILRVAASKAEEFEEYYQIFLLICDSPEDSDWAREIARQMEGLAYNLHYYNNLMDCIVRSLEDRTWATRLADEAASKMLLDSFREGSWGGMVLELATNMFENTDTDVKNVKDVVECMLDDFYNYGIYVTDLLDASRWVKELRRESKLDLEFVDQFVNDAGNMAYENLESGYYHDFYQFLEEIHEYEWIDRYRAEYESEILSDCEEHGYEVPWEREDF